MGVYAYTRIEQFTERPEGRFVVFKRHRASRNVMSADEPGNHRLELSHSDLRIRDADQGTPTQEDRTSSAYALPPREKNGVLDV